MYEDDFIWRWGEESRVVGHQAKAEESLAKSHQAHTKLLSYDAAAQDLQVTIFMVHAADHLNAAETIFLLAKELILLHGGVEHV